MSQARNVTMDKRYHPVILVGLLYNTMGNPITPQCLLYNHPVFNVSIPAKLLQRLTVLIVHNDPISSRQQHLSVDVVVVPIADPKLVLYNKYSHIFVRYHMSLMYLLMYPTNLSG